MSQYYLILLWIGFMAYMSYRINTHHYEYLNGTKVYRTDVFWAILIFIPIFFMMALRPDSLGDTGAYSKIYKEIPDTFRQLYWYVKGVTKDRGFTVLSGIIKIFFGADRTLYFIILAAIQSISLIYVYRKYSEDYLISIFLFVASTDYISWMGNGIRQFTAVIILFAATPLMLKKKWISLIAVILLATTIHGSAILMLPIILIAQGRAWNKRTILFTFASIGILFFASRFTSFLEILLSDTQYTNVVSDWNDFGDEGTNIIRVLVYAVPVILSFIGRKYINQENNPVINLCTNMSIISTAIYIISSGTSGVFIGRLPIYASLYGYILLPYLIRKMFLKSSEKLLKVLMVFLYIVYYYYQVHVIWGIA
ncbi:capsular polysaccharide biosynthesis protein [Lachnospiraceae bacterium TWA4]|nr:capsular polysaccharide biosynthesis protein [Lachnospiraceae bacterium TWA4]